MKASKQLRNHIVYAASIAGLGLVLTFFTHTVIEPQITHSQVATSTFTIQQTFTAESSFFVDPSDVTMVGTINGLTGGQATGTTDFSVLTNNAAGYYVEISFADADADGESMQGSISSGGEIRDYSGDVGGEPSFGFTASTAAQFAYTVSSDDPNDTDQSFYNNGAACNTGFIQTVPCWKAPATSGFQIVRRTGSATTPATSTITFSVDVPSSATPTPLAETYTATATLSLYNI